MRLLQISRQEPPWVVAWASIGADAIGSGFQVEAPAFMRGQCVSIVEAGTLSEFLGFSPRQFRGPALKREFFVPTVAGLESPASHKCAGSHPRGVSGTIEAGALRRTRRGYVFCGNFLSKSHSRANRGSESIA